MLFNIIKFGGATPTLRNLILKHANVKTVDQTVPKGLGYNPSLVVDGLLSAEQVQLLASCGRIYLTTKTIDGDEYVSYAFDSGGIG